MYNTLVMGTLYIVATPIGNLNDISLRVVDTIMNADFIACEDTRKTGLLLKYIEEKFFEKPPKKPLFFSYYEQNEQRRIPEIIKLLKEGKNIVLASDAGTPTISDPGYKLVREVIKEGLLVVSIPGPSSIISALVSSGLPTDKFVFYGFPPHKKGHRVKMFKNISLLNKTMKLTIIFFEAPHKLINTLKEMQNEFGDIYIVIARELTKKFEEIRREKINESINHFSKTKPKGEITILFRLESL
ncbi:MAG: 16S rRNA (cytidine(1402)-2'-O)-methyltransferase [Candidatus Levyibacteriota bacterium]